MRLRSFAIGCLVLSVGCGSKVVEGESGDGGREDSVPGRDADRPDNDAPVELPPPVPTSKLDLLFVIDNSMSMADKQVELARAVPRFVRDLTTPSAGGAVQSLHVGVITSSLGSHGTSACAVELTSRANNDKGHLLPRPGEGGGTGFTLDGAGNPVPTACPAPGTASVVNWVFTPGVEPGPEYAATVTSCVIQSVKEQGCGYEESLEAMYHFLLDPAPYARAEVKCTFGVSGDACGSNKIVVEGLDTDLLAQRAAFLRHDSSVAIVMLSDENDASLEPTGLNWLPWGYGHRQMQRGWSSCASVPDSFEPETPADFVRLHDEYKCFSCFENSADPDCRVPWPSVTLNTDNDSRNLRAFQQVQRYGHNFLWGRDRYVRGLTHKLVVGSDNREAPNPLFASGGRSAGNVIFAAIVGVPPHLVNGAGSVPKPLLSSAEWDRLVGPVGVRDPHMIESIAPRVGVPKYAGSRDVDPVNGGDRDILGGDELQYACIAPRASTSPGFECEGVDAHKRSPLCTPDGRQAYYKAYPGLRHLRVAQSVGGYVASICDPNLGNALSGLASRIRALIK